MWKARQKIELMEGFYCLCWCHWNVPAGWIVIKNSEHLVNKGNIKKKQPNKNLHFRTHFKRDGSRVCSTARVNTQSNKAELWQVNKLPLCSWAPTAGQLCLLAYSSNETECIRWIKMYFPNSGEKHEESVITTQLLGNASLHHSDSIVPDGMPKRYIWSVLGAQVMNSNFPSLHGLIAFHHV